MPSFCNYLCSTQQDTDTTGHLGCQDSIISANQGWIISKRPVRPTGGHRASPRGEPTLSLKARDGLGTNAAKTPYKGLGLRWRCPCSGGRSDPWLPQISRRPRRGLERMQNPENRNGFEIRKHRAFAYKVLYTESSIVVE